MYSVEKAVVESSETRHKWMRGVGDEKGGDHAQESCPKTLKQERF